MDLSVRLEWVPHFVASGRLRDVSLSGAFVEGVPLLPLWTEVYAQLEVGGCSECDPVKGYVIRNEPGGLAVEWSEFAPREIRRLIDESATGPMKYESPPDERDSFGFLSRMRETRCGAPISPQASAVQGLNAAPP